MYISYSHKRASTFVAEGIHQAHLELVGRSEGLGGNNRTEMNFCILAMISRNHSILYVLSQWTRHQWVLLGSCDICFRS